MGFWKRTAQTPPPRIKNVTVFLFIGQLLLIVSPPALITGGVNKEDTLPLMKLKQSRCCPLASKASHWPPVSSRGGSSDEGGGVRFFSYCLCPAEGLNLGLEQLGFVWKCSRNSNLKPAWVWPRFSPDLTPDQHHNLHVSRVTVFRSAGACRGSAAVGGGGVIWGSMHDQLGRVQVSTRD